MIVDRNRNLGKLKNKAQKSAERLQKVGILRRKYWVRIVLNYQQTPYITVL